MGEHATGTFVDHLERTEHADRLADRAVLGAEPHAVDRERRSAVAHEGALRLPGAHRARRLVVAAGVVVRSRHVDLDDVAVVAGAQRRDVCCREHVVGRGGGIVEGDGGGVAEGRERFESGHPHRLAARVPR